MATFSDISWYVMMLKNYIREAAPTIWLFCEANLKKVDIKRPQNMVYEIWEIFDMLSLQKVQFLGV